MILNGSNEFTQIELNDIGYVFSPNIVQIGAPMTEINKVEISIADKEGKSYRETWVFNEVTVAKRDISYILREFIDLERLNPFSDGKSETCVNTLSLSFNVITNDGTDVYSIDNYTIIFGAMRPYDSIFDRGRSIKVKRFVYFPFSLDFPLMIGGAVKYSNESDIRYRHREPGNALISLNSSGVYYGNYTVSMLKSFNTNTYNNYPFVLLNQSSNVKYEVDIDTCISGIYLMWLNHWGGKSYFLFKKKGDMLKVDGEEYNKKNIYDLRLNDTVNQWNKTAKRVLTLALPLAEKNIYDYVEEVLYSPMVYMFDIKANAFIRVNVQTGDFERTSAELQDFVFKIELPEELTIKI